MRKAIKGILLFLSGAIIGLILAWIARGVYDRYFEMKGYFHVVNHSSTAHDISLRFPSGKTKAFSMKPGSSQDFRVNDTGEGSITINVDGNDRDQVGYVTSINHMVVLVIGEERSSFSQFFTPVSTASY